LSLDLKPGNYFIAVTASGNDNYNANVTDSGMGGLSQGAYDLRLSFSPIPPGTQLLDAGGSALDGDLNGVAGGEFNFWFQVGKNNTTNTGKTGAANSGSTIFVDKQTGSDTGDGTLAHPLKTIGAAITAYSAKPGNIIRVEGNDPL